MGVAWRTGWLCLLLCVSTVSWALIGSTDRGEWPEWWPKELEPLRSRAKTVMVAHGVQETVYEMGFSSAEEFAELWPFVLSVKHRRAPVILENGPSRYATSGTTLTVGVRILHASDAVVNLSDGIKLTAGQPWPQYLYGNHGELPEYVVQADGKWKADPDKTGLFRYRARTDIVVVADGRIIDPTRIAVSSGTPLIDRRGEKERAENPVVPDPVDRLVAELASSHGLWQNGASPVIDLPSTATVEQVVARVLDLTSPDEGKITTHTIRRTQQVKIPGGSPGSYTAALLDTNIGPWIVLLERGTKSWWSRLYKAK